MANKRKRHSPEFKAKVALEALKGDKTSHELAQQYSIHPTQIAQWKRDLREHASDVFASPKANKDRDREVELSQAFEKIGRLNMELAWLQKKSAQPSSIRRCLIEPDHSQLSIARQCTLLGLPRRSYYYQPMPVSAAQLALMRSIDRQHLETPWYGSRQMTAGLRRQGWRLNRKRIQRLMRLMGIQGLNPGPHTSTPHPAHPVYPYLLRRYPPVAPDDAWAADITWIPMPIGFMYLIAVIDWHSRFVLAWTLSNTLETAFCLEALEAALSGFGPPSICNSDQGTQFTSAAFTDRLKAAAIAISMDGRGRAFDNSFVERLWRSVKYESIYLNEFGDVASLQHGLTAYFHYFNHDRPHQGLAQYTPAEVYHGNMTSNATAE